MKNLRTNLPNSLALIIFALVALNAATTFATSDKVSPTLLSKSNSSGKYVNVIAFLNESGIPAMNKAASLGEPVRSKKGHAQMLKSLQTGHPLQTSFVEFLKQLADSGQVEDVKNFWIANAVSFKVDASYLDNISNRSELYYLVEDVPLELVTPVSMQDAVSSLAGSDNEMAITGVRQLWNMGYTGHGRLVCSFDTGVEGTHPALANTWYGNHGGTPQEAWFDPYGTTTPTDGNGHGTHTMGIMVGRDGDDTIGVAFNANWMSAAVIDRGQSLNKTLSDILNAFQWVADPDGNPNTANDLPDVICNSWGIPKGLLPACDETFYEAIDNLEALGVVCIFACGNEGPTPSSIRNPADRGTTPLNSFSIGAVDQNQPDLPIAPFSSRGPANCDPTRIKPELVAPGVTIRSSYKGGGYKTISGTSMAAPFVAGCVALMREYNPDATVDQIKNALIHSAQELGTPGQDNDYGWGFINVARALNFLPTPQKSRVAVKSLRLDQSNNGILKISNTTALEVSLENTVAPAVGLRGKLHTYEPHAYILKDSVDFGNLNANATGDNLGNPFMIKLDYLALPGTVLNFTIDFYSAQTGYLNSTDFKLVVGEPVVASDATIKNGRLSFESSNFGTAVRIDDSSWGFNSLSQLSLLLSDSHGTIYDAFPGTLDFVASDTIYKIAGSTSSQSTAFYHTSDNKYTITQNSTLFSTNTTNNFILLDYSVKPTSPSFSGPISFALATDIDFTGGETFSASGKDMIINSQSGTQLVGIRMLSSTASFGYAISGTSYKSNGITDAQKYSILAAAQTNLTAAAGDNAIICGLPQVNLSTAGGDFGVVIAVGNTIEEIEVALQQGQAKYNQATDVTDQNDLPLPKSITLGQNFPNPFNMETAIDYTVPTQGNYKFEIFDILGRNVNTVELNHLIPGSHALHWDGKDKNGTYVTSGVYLYRLSSNGNSQTRKMVIIK